MSEIRGESLDLSDALPPDELRLARLTAVKLAKVMFGLMSVGTGSLLFDPPNDFLAGREKTGQGFLEVLGYTGVKAGHSDKQPILWERVQRLSALAERCCRQLIRLNGWRSMTVEQVATLTNQLSDDYAQFCRDLGEFCSLLGPNADFSEQAANVRLMLDSFGQTATALTASAT
jgi:hypothetical protein